MIDYDPNEFPRRFMIEIFRLAIPEISGNALEVFVRNNPYLDQSDGELVELKDYDVSGPGDLRYKFTIARKIVFVDYVEPGKGLIGLAPVEIVFVLETEILDHPGLMGYITEY